MMNKLLNYSNPVWDGYCADPFVLRHDERYYCYGTGGDASQMQGRKFVLLRSPDLVNWEFVGSALEPIQGHEHAAHWAPEVAFANGKFWMYYSVAAPDEDDSTHRLRVAMSDLPTGPFRDQGVILLPGEGFTIDASPFCDPRDGQWYLFFAKDFFDGRPGTGNAVIALNSNMMSVFGEPHDVVIPHSDWHISSRDRQLYDRDWKEWHTIEGAHVVFKDGLYYCFYSGGAWQNETYGVSYAVAEHPLGPWRDEWSSAGPQVLQGVPPHIIGPGHNSVTTAPDGETLICVYHSWDAAHTGRRLCIDPIEWTENGPHVTPTWKDGRLPIG